MRPPPAWDSGLVLPILETLRQPSMTPPSPAASMAPPSGPIQLWPHRISSLFACLCCVLGMYNVSRFAMMVYIFKGAFILEFLILSLLIGFPFLYLFMALGQHLGPGIVDMWYISPAFKGVGLAFLFLYCMVSVYSAVPIAWMLVYFKDSFVTAKDSFRWRRCHASFSTDNCLAARNSSSLDYYSWTVSSYFNGRVLGRLPNESLEFGEIKLDVAFNLFVVWAVVFAALSRGTKSLGKVVSILGALPLFLLMMVFMRIIEQWQDGIADIFQSTWSPLVSNPMSWLVASREVVLTWCMYGLVVFHHCGHNKPSSSVTKALLFVATMGTMLLIISSFFIVSTINLLLKRSLALTASSYETESSVRFMQQSRSALELGAGTLNFTVVNLLLGEILLPSSPGGLSGYQVLRFATEIFPTALATEGIETISSFWAICFYGMMILFGLGQLVSVWSCIVESIVRLKGSVLQGWHISVAFTSCKLAFILGLPLTSNLGIYIIFFLEFCVGSLWWVLALYLLLMVAVLFVRGQLYGTDKLIELLHPAGTSSWLHPFLTILWNLVLPVAFMVLLISFLRSAQFDPVQSWHGFHSPGGRQYYPFWPEWVRALSAGVQLFPLALVGGVCLLQAYRHLHGPVESSAPSTRHLSLANCIEQCCCPIAGQRDLDDARPQATSTATLALMEDPPPKYTPPPSYSTATSRHYFKLIGPPPSYADLLKAASPDALDSS